MNYRYIDIENLIEIQQEVLSVIPDKFKKQNLLGFVGSPEESRSLFTNLPTLHELLTRLKILDDVFSVALISIPKNTTYIHIDEGPYRLSLNIPIQFCENTDVKIYKSLEDPVKYNFGKNISSVYRKEACVLEEVCVTDRPYILDTKIPHAVSNPNTGTVRIMMLVRLNPRIDFNYFNGL